MPLVSIHKSKGLKSDIKSARLNIVKEEKHDLFLFVLSPLGTVFPSLEYLFSESILNFLYDVEKALLKRDFFQKFAGATVLWLSH